MAGLGIDFEEIAEEIRVSSTGLPSYSDATTTGSPTGSRHTYAVSLSIFSVLALDVDIDGRSSSGRTVL